MIFFLLFSLFLITVFEYFCKCKYIMHPVMVVLYVFDLSVLVAAANFSKWGDIGPETCYVILAGVMSFVIFSNITEKVTLRFGSLHGKITRKSELCNSIFSSKIYINSYVSFFVLLIVFVTTILDFIDILKISGGGYVGLLGVVSNARHAFYQGAALNHSTIVLQGIYFTRAASYVYIFVVCYKLLILRQHPKLIEILVICLYLVQALLSTGRTEFMYAMYSVLIITYCVSMENIKWVSRSDFRYVKKMVFAFFLFMVFFLFLSNSRSKNGDIDILKTVSTYVASSIYALDKYIVNNGLKSVATFWGEETQPLFYSILKMIGVSDNTTIGTLAPISFVNNGTTNIYTAFRRYLHDYGLSGVVLINAFLGIFYTSLFKKIRNNWSPLRIAVFAFVSYPLIEFSIEERFFSNFITFRSVCILFYICFFFKAFIKFYEE